MSPRKSALALALDALEELYGPPRKPLPRNPLEWILWENVAYLVDDERREVAYRALAKKVGLDAEAIAGASTKVLREVTQLGGMHPEARVDRLKGIGELALAGGAGDLALLEKLPLPKAKALLKKYPGIGDPGAEKILVFCGELRTPVLESNGLRAVVRLGYGTESSSYAATYKSAQRALASEIAEEKSFLVRAHLLLRTHGRELCKRTAPDCDACPLSDRCRYFASLG